jgi:hypothetical protein
MRPVVVLFLLGALLAGGLGLGFSRSPAAPREPPAPTPSGGGGGARWMGVASCSASGCHHFGEGKEVKRSEYTTWVAYDRHHRAFDVLFSDRSKQIVRNLSPDSPVEAPTNPLCLRCHAMANSAGVQEPVGERFSLSDGVGCESCHGPAENWLEPHSRDGFKALSPKVKEKDYGLRNTKNLTVRVQLCTGCHVSHEDRDVDHEMIAAGHPRLNFEFGGYMAVYPRHWPEAEDRARYPDFDVRTWLVGQVAVARASVDLLRARAERAVKDGGKKWPEFSEYGCYACHKDLGVTDLKQPGPRWRVADPTRVAGVPPWGTWDHGLALSLDVRRPGPLTAFSALQDLMRRPLPDPAAVAQEAQRALEPLDAWLAALDDWPAGKLKPFDPSETSALYKALLTESVRKARGLEWDDAAQLYLGLTALDRQLPADSRRRDDLRDLARWLRGSFPTGADSPTSFKPLEKPTLEDRLLGLRKLDQ